MRFRLTLRGEDVEMRGYLDGPVEMLYELAAAVKPYGILVASPAPEGYDPFSDAEADAALRKIAADIKHEFGLDDR
jgi:hypothetical protein